jgi:rSAM/selenodomain-associated transferase 1
MPNNTTNALIVVAKQPAPGKTKTRLSPPLSPRQASDLYDCFLRDTLETMRQVEHAQPVIAYLPPEAHNHFKQLAPDFQLSLQQGADLGARLDHALTTWLSNGYISAVIMNSDSPTLPTGYISQAFASLSGGADVVLGPCDDGGYYLIGLRQPAPRLLREVRMSTATVAADTIALVKEEGLSISLLPTWYDVDDAAALSRLVQEVKMLEASAATHTRRFLQENSIQRLLAGSAEI